MLTIASWRAFEYHFNLEATENSEPRALLDCWRVFLRLELVAAHLFTNPLCTSGHVKNENRIRL